MTSGNDFKKFILKDVKPKDDAFYGLTKHVSSEWWYFEAFFDNGYSAVIGFTTSFKNLIAFPAIEIYKNGELEVRAIKRYFFHKFQLSKQIPSVKLFDKEIIEFDQKRFDDKGEWVYNVSSKIDDNAVKLKFIGTTPGWKYKREVESWIVVLPKAKVTGEIVVHGKKIKVNGIGYHDHNWVSNLSNIINVWGWYWGKITTKTLNITWANIVKKSTEEELIAVVNQDNQGYFAINPKNIHFKSDKFIRNHNRKMPTSITLKIDDIVNDVPIKVDVKMEVKGIHRRYNRLLIAPYWRYHVKATGEISLGSHKETVNRTQMMEFFRLI